MTSLIRFSPSTEMRSLQREIDRVFDGFFTARSNESNGSQSAVWTPRVDLAETEDAYLIHADLPGVAREDLDINFQDGQLAISGERKIEQTEEKPNFVRVERTSGSFFRSFTLPKTINPEEIKAEYADGVLTVHIPKAEEQRPRRIEVS